MKFELQVFVLSQATPPVPFPNSCCLRVDRKDRRTVCWYTKFSSWLRRFLASLCRASFSPGKCFNHPTQGYTEIGGRICGGGRVRKSAARELVNANRGWEISIYWLGCNQCSTRRFWMDFDGGVCFGIVMNGIKIGFDFWKSVYHLNSFSWYEFIMRMYGSYFVSKHGNRIWLSKAHWKCKYISDSLEKIRKDIRFMH